MNRSPAKKQNISVVPADAIKTDNNTQLLKNLCNTIPEGKYAEWTKPPIFYMAIPLRLSYCVVQHDMDDIWKQIFNVLRNLNNETGDVSEFLGQYDRLMGIKEKVPFRSRWRRNSETVLFVRDPYIRLFSAFYDRFYVEHNTCEYISFQEFLDKVITGVKLRLEWGTKIMVPLVPNCKICDIKLFEIVREESFQQDLLNMFKRLNISQTVTATLMGLLQKPIQFIASVLHSKLLLQFTDLCPLAAGLVPRFWKSLQNMGIISKYLSYPSSLEGVDVTKDLKGLVLAAVHATMIIPMSEQDRESQKREAIADAYADIKDETIEYIQEIFKYDFEMFGYSKERPR